MTGATVSALVPHSRRPPHPSNGWPAEPSFLVLGLALGAAKKPAAKKGVAKKAQKA